MSAPADTLCVEPVDGGRALAVSGELTHATAATLAERLRDSGVPAPHVVLDVSGLTVCDSAGLAALIGIQRRAARDGGAVTLRGPRRALRRILQLTGVEELFVVELDSDADDPEVRESQRA